MMHCNLWHVQSGGSKWTPTTHGLTRKRKKEAPNINIVYNWERVNRGINHWPTNVIAGNGNRILDTQTSTNKYKQEIQWHFGAREWVSRLKTKSKHAYAHCWLIHIAINENQAQFMWTNAYGEKCDVWKSVWAHFIVIFVNYLVTWRTTLWYLVSCQV